MTRRTFNQFYCRPSSCMFTEIRLLHRHLRRFYLFARKIYFKKHLFNSCFCILNFLLINQALFSFEMRIYVSFSEMNMILMTITKAQLLSLDSWNMRNPSSKFCSSYLLKNFTLIKALFLLKNRFCLSCVFFSFFDLLIHMTTETTQNSCSFWIKCSIQILPMMPT